MSKVPYAFNVRTQQAKKHMGQLAALSKASFGRCAKESMEVVGRISRIHTSPSAAAAFILLFVALIPFASAQTAVTIINNGDPANRVDIAVLGDGYAAADMSKYAVDVQMAINGFFAQQPFKEYQDYFNVHRVDVVSADSGVSHPELTPPVTKNTAFGAYYNCQEIQRLICVDNNKVMIAVSKALPSTKRDIILVIVNDSTYGGSGGAVAVVSTNSAVIEVVLHEEGHTLGLLGDEYTDTPPSCDTSSEPSDANITMQTQRDKIKWAIWIDNATAIPTNTTTSGIPGLYKGAQYCASGKYRPTYNSKMRSLNVPFEQVNSEQLIKRIYNWVSPLDTASPSAANVTVTHGRKQVFSVTIPSPLTHNLSVSWSIDGKSAGTELKLTVDSSALTIGSHTVTSTIDDKTDLVRNDSNKVLHEIQSWTLNVAKPAAINLPLNTGGVAIASTAGGDGALRVGYATVTVTGSMSIPYGTAVFSLKQGGVTVAETGVPSSPPTTSARLFIDYRADVPAVPGHNESGLVHINTGIAVVNTNTVAASIAYTLRDANLNPVASGRGTIAAGRHISGFIDELDKKGVSGFAFPQDFANSSQFGILDITSDHPVSVLALRGTQNQEDNFLITTTPIADLNQTLSAGEIYFPHFVEGGGYTTSLILLNTSTSTESGQLRIRDKDGSELFVSQVGGKQDWSFPYSIPPGGFFRFQTDGFPADVKKGWVQLIPDPGTYAPVGTGVFAYNPGNVLISESGIPSSPATTHARIYADLTGTYNTGLAIANVSGASSGITISAFQNDGVTPAGTSLGPLLLPVNGYDAEFASQFIAGLPPGFTGVLDIRSENPFSALTVRSMTNELNRFLMATFPVADVNKTAPSTIVFPQIADGDGYTSQIILISPSGASSTKLQFYGEDGIPIDLSQ
jgi:hypothetical protein